MKNYKNKLETQNTQHTKHKKLDDFEIRYFLYFKGWVQIGEWFAFSLKGKPSF
jgi:hypothetical protein